MKVLIKGGIWKNTEDEILKAAIMKYGKNQWARISSLLVRKTPKQCKSRWYEWLDPSIKKTEWAKEEDEKLLHLSKLMPAQWRTIAPIVGRTPVQCIERYQRLLDEAELKQPDDTAPSAEDIRRLRPGEVDPEPEAKPARPDPVDMDEDEKEMLSEARARLANTQGKKAKRKARERQLDEARRMALIQKRRELRAAGMDINVNKHIRGTNYNAEIPFFTKAPAGFYDIADEREKEALNPKDLLNRSLQELDGKKKLDMSEAKKNDAKKQRQKKNAGEYAPQEALRLAEEVRLKRTDRKEMNLPAPQVSDMELEEIIKIGYASETVRQTVGTDGPSNALLNKATPVVKDVGRTPLVASSQDTLRMEARNIKNLSSSQTPLLGGDIQIEGENSFTATPRNVTATPSSFSSFTPRSQVNQFNPKLASKFMKLPMPKNEFSIVVPENEIFEELGCLMVEDAEEVASRRLIIEQEEEQARLMKLSRPVFFDLPRPLAMNMSAFDEVKGESEVDRLIRIELKSIMMHDALENPYPGSLLPNYSQSDTGYKEFNKTLLDEALELIQAEFKVLKVSLKPEALEETIRAIEELSNTHVFIQGSYKLTTQVSEKEQILDYVNKLDDSRTNMQSLAKKSGKLEKKANLLMNGYQAKCQQQEKERLTKKSLILEREITIGSFESMFVHEESGGVSRLENLSLEVERLKCRDTILQQEYFELLSERNEIKLTQQ